MRYWDSSALVPLIVLQAVSSQAETWLAEDPELVVWTLSSVEVVSALRRLLREESLDERQVREAEQLAKQLFQRCHTVTAVERVKVQATRALRVHSLRGADALQLGAALVWADGEPSGLSFHTFDRRLAIAAEREGFRLGTV